MPLYEYYCKNCHGIFETIRPMREASLPVPCLECNRDAARIMSSFNAFVFRDGYPRRLPDKGTYWHLGKEVKKRAKRMKGFEHPELAKPKLKQTKTSGDLAVERDRKRLERAEALYRNRWGIDKDGFRTTKAARPSKPARKVVGSGKTSSKR